MTTMKWSEADECVAILIILNYKKTPSELCVFVVSKYRNILLKHVTFHPLEREGVTRFTFKNSNSVTCIRRVKKR